MVRKSTASCNRPCFLGRVRELILLRSPRINNSADDALLGLETMVKIYQAIDATPSSTVDIINTINYTLAMLTLILPYMIQWLA